MIRTSLALALALGVATTAAAPSVRAEDLGDKIGGAFTDAYKGLRDGVLGAYDTSRKGTVEKWHEVTGTNTASTAQVQIEPVGMNADVQRELIAAGYNPGPVDGRYGPMTGTAIRSYQIDNGLPQDGQVSASLLNHLQAKRMASGGTQSAAVQPAPVLPAPVVTTTTETVVVAPAGTTIVPALPAQTAQGQIVTDTNCQPYKTRTIINGQEIVTEGKSCLQPDGTWKPIN